MHSTSTYSTGTGKVSIVYLQLYMLPGNRVGHRWGRCRLSDRMNRQDEPTARTDRENRPREQFLPICYLPSISLGCGSGNGTTRKGVLRPRASRRAPFRSLRLVDHQYRCHYSEWTTAYSNEECCIMRPAAAAIQGRATSTRTVLPVRYYRYSITFTVTRLLVWLPSTVYSTELPVPVLLSNLPVQFHQYSGI